MQRLKYCDINLKITTNNPKYAKDMSTTEVPIFIEQITIINYLLVSVAEQTFHTICNRGHLRNRTEYFLHLFNC